VNGLFRLKATARSPVESLLYGEPVAQPVRKGPSLLFAGIVIGGVAVGTAGGVAAFFVDPSQSASDQVASDVESVIAADQPIVTASLDPILPPVHKVVTRSIRAPKQDGLAQSAKLPQPERPVQVAWAEETAKSYASGETDSLEQQDPRWAMSEEKTDAFASVIPVTEDAATEPDVAATLDDQPTAYADTPSDKTRTAAIAPDEAKPIRKAKRGKADDEAKADEPPGAGGSTRTATVSKGVNMRARPKSGSGILTTIPRSAVVQVVGCKSWCEVIYKGRRGYIYKSFIGGSQRVSSKKSKATTAKAAESDKPKTVYVVDSEKKQTAEMSSASTGNMTVEYPARAAPMRPSSVR
jgi:uncharacterized protein YraI